MSKPHLIAATMAMFLLVISGVAQVNGLEEAPARILGLSVSTRIVEQPAVLTRKSRLTLEVELRNDGKTPLELFKNVKWGASASLLMTLLDRSGEGVEPLLLDDSLIPPPPTGQYPSSFFVTLAPGQSLKSRRIVFLSNFAIKESGSYALTVTYTSPVFRSQAPGEPSVVTREDGSFKSLPLNVAVR